MKFIKRKIAVCLLVLFACTGMAMAGTNTTSSKTTNTTPSKTYEDGVKETKEKICKDIYGQVNQSTYDNICGNR